MKTKDLLDITPAKLLKMGEKELRKVVSTLRSTARKRYERLAEKGFYTVPMKTLSRKSPNARDVLPSVKNADVVTLRNEYKRFSQFLKAKTSTVGGARKAEKQAKNFIKEITGRDDFTNEEISDIYRMADELSLTDEISHIVSSSQRVTAITEEYFPNRSKDEIIQGAKEKVKTAYERQLRNGATPTSEFFE